MWAGIEFGQCGRTRWEIVPEIGNIIKSTVVFFFFVYVSVNDIEKVENKKQKMKINE